VLINQVNDLNLEIYRDVAMDITTERHQNLFIIFSSLCLKKHLFRKNQFYDFNYLKSNQKKKLQYNYLVIKLMLNYKF
jgi:hypothetical protein